MNHVQLTAPFSLYIHIPFCIHRCAYCDFNTYAGQEDLIPAYVQALARELEFVGEAAGQRLQLHTVFFGGGTPSLLAPSQYETILQAIDRHFELRPQAELTTEANPGTVSQEQLHELRSLGLNRISFGAQSANGEELRMLERAHSFLDVIEAVTGARRAGFDNLNLDLIYGLPEQNLHTWKTTLERVLELSPEHISAYALTLEHGTPFGRWAARGLLPIPDPDAAADMYEDASERLAHAGYVQYEISNWARDVKRQPSKYNGPTSKVETRAASIQGDQSVEGRDLPSLACRHNVQYWRCLPYLGLGAGAHGYADRRRYSNVLRIKTYIDRLSTSLFEERALEFPLTPAAVNQHRQTRGDERSDFMITGLRLTREGIGTEDFRGRFGEELEDVYRDEIGDLIRLGLLERIHDEASETPVTAGEPDWQPGASEALRLTARGRLLGNQVFMRFL